MAVGLLSIVADARTGRLTVSGDLDAVAAPQFMDSVRAALAEAVPPVVELNLAGLTFLDSVGIRSLLDCRRLVLDAGGRLVLVDPPRLVTRILDITGLLDYFPMSFT